MEQPQELSVLVVEDTLELRELLVFVFTEAGFKVIEAHGGCQALKIFHEQSFDAVITDIEMSGGNGIDLLEKIKTIRPCLPVFLMSGNPDKFREMASCDKAEAFFSKPFDHQRMIDLIRRACVINKIR